MNSFTNRKFKNTNYHMANDIVKEKTQDDLDREKKTQEAKAKNQSLKNQQKEVYEVLTKNANLNPPEYPIRINVKENKWNSDFIEDSTGSLIYASSFEDATSKVKNFLLNPNSTIQQSYNKSGLNPNNNILRLSSQNKGMFRSFVNDLNKPSTTKLELINKWVDYWVIILSNAPPSTISNFRISNQKNYNKGGKSKKIRKKTKKYNLKKKKTKRRLK